MDGRIREEEAGPIIGVGGGADWFEDGGFFVVAGGFVVIGGGSRGRGSAPRTSGHNGNDGRTLLLLDRAALCCTGTACDPEQRAMWDIAGGDVARQVGIGYSEVRGLSAREERLKAEISIYNRDQRISNVYRERGR